MAPEQIGKGEASVRSDIYSLGLVFYELFTGTPSLSGNHPDRVATGASGVFSQDTVVGGKGH